jgi:hypothetical protein
MSETSTAPTDRDQCGRFLTGGKPGPGRRVGSRNLLAQDYIRDLSACWERHGLAALETCAREQPEVLVKVIASLLPRDVNLSVGLDVASFASAFEVAIKELHGDQAMKLKPLRQKMIEHGRHR